MTEAYRRVEKTLDEIIEEHLRSEKLFLYSGIEANINIGIQAVENNDIEETHSRWRGDVVRSALQGCADRGMFAQNGNYLRALDAVYSHYPRFARVSGNDRMIVHFALKKNVPFEAQALADMIAEQEVWDSLALAPQYIEQTQAAKQSEQWVNQMTSGGSKTFSLRTPNGNSRTYDPQGREIQFSGSGGRRFISGDQGFAGMTDEQIGTMHAQWSQEQKYKSMSVKELKQQVRQQGQQRYENRFHADPTTGVPVTTSTKQLIDPRSGQPFTSKAQLVSWINSSRFATAQLLQRNGKVDPELAREFERILNGR